MIYYWITNIHETVKKLSLYKSQNLSVKEKLEILKNYDELPNMPQQETVSKPIRISQTVVCELLKNEIEVEYAALRNENIASTGKG